MAVRRSSASFPTSVAGQEESYEQIEKFSVSACVSSVCLVSGRLTAVASAARHSSQLQVAAGVTDARRSASGSSTFWDSLTSKQFVEELPHITLRSRSHLSLLEFAEIQRN